MKSEPNNHTAEYYCREKITDPHAFRLALERERNPNILSGKDRVYALYQMMGMKIDYGEIFAD